MSIMITPPPSSSAFNEDPLKTSSTQYPIMVAHSISDLSPPLIATSSASAPIGPPSPSASTTSSSSRHLHHHHCTANHQDNRDIKGVTRLHLDGTLSGTSNLMAPSPICGGSGGGPTHSIHSGQHHHHHFPGGFFGGENLTVNKLSGGDSVAPHSIYGQPHLTPPPPSFNGRIFGGGSNGGLPTSFHRQKQSNRKLNSGTPDLQISTRKWSTEVILQSRRSGSE